jgi:hypothetical protein
MFFLVKPNWKKLNKSIWTSLEKKTSAPPDMYIELLRFARRKLDVPTEEATDVVLSDPSLARNAFFKLPEPQSESQCIELLEGFYDTLQEEFRTKIAQYYKQELKKFVEERNLRYYISDNCKFQLSIQGLLMSQCEKFRNMLFGNAHMEQSLRLLEASVSRLMDVSDEERNCIGIATNLLEGVACTRTTNNQNTLGAAIEGCNVFPHDALMRCVKDFYRFASDYPNIRHAGNPASKLRDLKKDDALLAVTFALGFGSYVFNNDSGQKILQGEL